MCTTAKEAFRLSGTELSTLAREGNSVAVTELKRRIAKARSYGYEAKAKKLEKLLPEAKSETKAKTTRKSSKTSQSKTEAKKTTRKSTKATPEYVTKADFDSAIAEIKGLIASLASKAQ